ncbi:DUF5367 family protein [Flavobacterium aquicola]|uniref:Uncharacterized protein n=1 Tax=Flavobacterium aquicola TaxID=1682742 RepID=A0A3E0E203_9FLAO|nr:DUF5367 family protein [Flavobacterium aquicola]REG92268.1 hypothetical protein C8P67_115115 [Flavobacterium aquicola]
MNWGRAIFSGVIAWLCVVITFYILEHIPLIQKSSLVLAVIAAFTIVFYAWIAAVIYYKKAVKESGLQVGIVITVTALILDVLITVPFIEIPKGSSYQQFFSNPLLWILAVINVITVFVYWKLNFDSRPN